jgi:uncharacterized repeat protein (TIGR03803 family)
MSSCARFFLVIALSYASLFLPIAAPAQTVRILHAFSGPDGAYASGRLVFDSAGNLYGTTYNGGEKRDNGVVYELSPAADGSWTETVIYSFAGGNDGKNPHAGIIFDKAGNLFGTTFMGGRYDAGTVFELSPAIGGGWTEKVLYSFLPHHNDAITPSFPLVMDASGNLFGCALGGAEGIGAVFELTPVANGRWKESVILDGDVDGSYFQGLAFDQAGNLYVEAFYGGTAGNGTIQRLTHTAAGWQRGIVHSFQAGSDGSNPEGGLTFQPPNRILGVTPSGGTFDYGTAFKLVPAQGGTWSETILYNFGTDGGSSDAISPIFPLTIGGPGKVFGLTGAGGSLGQGAAFELTDTSEGWAENILYSYPGGQTPENANDGFVLDGAGNLYAVDSYQTPDNYGAVYEITP